MSPELRFLPDGPRVRAPEGASLRSVAEAAGADLVFGCGTGTCGSCRVRVARGLECCSPPSREERDFLEALHAPPDHRLACRVQILGDLDVEILDL